MQVINKNYFFSLAMMTQWFAVPELLVLVLSATLSRPVRNREFIQLMRFREVSHLFAKIVEQNVLGIIEKLPVGIARKMRHSDLYRLTGLPHLSTTTFPSIDESTLSTLVKLPSLSVSHWKSFDLGFLSFMTSLTRLHFDQRNPPLSRKELPFLTNLVDLTFHDTDLTNEDLSQLTKLTSLHSSNNPFINSDLLLVLTRITNISICPGSQCFPTREYVSRLTTLTIYKDDHYMERMGLENFSHLTKLELSRVTRFTSLEKLCSLKSLMIVLYKEPEGLYDSAPLLTNLTELCLKCSLGGLIDANHILPGMCRLEKLFLVGPGIGNGVLEKMTTLKDLKLISNRDISNRSIRHLTNLVRLDVQGCPRISSRSISQLSLLKMLRTRDIGFIDNSLLGLTKLTELSLTVAHCTFGLEELLVLPRLESVSMLGAVIEKETVKKFWDHGIYLC